MYDDLTNENLKIYPKEDDSAADSATGVVRLMSKMFLGKQLHLH